MDTQNLIWIAKKVIYLFLELFFAITLSFFLILAMPGNPYIIILQGLLRSGMPELQAEAEAAALAGYNPSEGVLGRYFTWIVNFFHGNLGYSVVYASKVSPVVAAAAPWTIIIVLVSLTLAFVTGFFLGLVAASTSSKALDAVISGLMSFFQSIPNYMLALLLLIVLAVDLHWFPLSGAYGLGVSPGLNFAYISSVAWHLALPILTFYLMLFPGWMFGTRAIATSLMKEDFIMVAKARGVSGNRMTFSYVGRNALLPQFTSLMYSYGLLFGSSIFIETIFDVPGLGYLLTTAAGARDYELTIGAFLIIIVAVIIGNFVADVGYGLIDPRVRGK
ncbi:MAG: ABC transporter permease [TACK group archaeon]|nr:ABC transporter permease [TACK group archaeon]